MYCWLFGSPNTKDHTISDVTDYRIGNISWEPGPQSSQFYLVTVLRRKSGCELPLTECERRVVKQCQVKNIYLAAGRDYAIDVVPCANVRGAPLKGAVKHRVVECSTAPVPVINWGAASLAQLQTHFRGYTPNVADVADANVLMLSGVGQGKSTLLNAWISLLAGRDRQPAPAFETADTLTTVYRCYPARFWVQPGCAINFCDLWGWKPNEDRRVIETNFVHVLQGRLRINMSQPMGVLASGTYELIPDAEVTVNDKIHVVALVVTAAQADDVHYMKQFQWVRDLVAQCHVRFIVIVTKIDRIACNKHTNTVTYPFASRPELVYELGEGREVLQRVAQYTGVPPADVYPVVNLRGTDPNDAPVAQRVLLLRALAKLLSRADDWYTAHGHMQEE